MERNLDEVLRAVPMDLSDNMEQISGSKPRTSVQSDRIKPSIPPPPSQPVSNAPRLPTLVPAPSTTPSSSEQEVVQETAGISSNGKGKMLIDSLL